VLRLPARRGPTLVLLGASTALALLSWYLQPFFVVLEGLLVWRDQRRASPARAGRWRSSTLALLVGALLALPWYIYALPRLLGKMGQGFDVNGNAPGVPALADVASQLVTAVIGRNDGWFYAVGLAGWLVALVLAAGLALWRGRVLAVQGIRWGPLDARGRAIVLVGGVVLGGVEVAVILARWQHPDAAGRYLIAIVPLIALLQAWAIVEGPQVARWVVAAGAGLAVAGQLSWFVPLARGAPIDWAHNPVLQYVAGVAQPGDALLFSDHAQRAQYLLNPLYNGGWPAWLVQTSGDTFLRDSPVQAGQTVRALVRSTSRVWYLESSEWPDAPRLGRDALISNAYFVSGRQVGDTNVQLFLTGQPDQRVALHDVLGGKIALIQAGYSTMAHPGGDMLVDLMWQSLQQTDVSYHVFVHIDDARDQTRAQHDGTPADGTMTTDHWHAGQVVDDRYGIVLPTSLLPGSYHVSVGLYAASGQRLPLPDGANSITLGELVVSG
jgi:hypothetical protein